jgi:P-type Mg2+ transporter
VQRRSGPRHPGSGNARASVALATPHAPIDTLLAELHASRGGQTSDEARRRLGEIGPNEPARAPRIAGLVQILLLLANSLVIILLIASAARLAAAIHLVAALTLISGVGVLLVMATPRPPSLAAKRGAT